MVPPPFAIPTPGEISGSPTAGIPSQHTTNKARERSQGNQSLDIRTQRSWDLQDGKEGKANKIENSPSERLGKWCEN